MPSYGPAAWFWESEELVRKLSLTAIAVLIDPSSPLQVNNCRQDLLSPSRQRHSVFLGVCLIFLVSHFLFLRGVIVDVDVVVVACSSYVLLLCNGVFAASTRDKLFKLDLPVFSDNVGGLLRWLGSCSAWCVQAMGHCVAHIRHPTPLPTRNHDGVPYGATV